MVAELEAEYQRACDAAQVARQEWTAAKTAVGDIREACAEDTLPVRWAEQQERRAQRGWESAERTRDNLARALEEAREHLRAERDRNAAARMAAEAAEAVERVRGTVERWRGMADAAEGRDPLWADRLRAAADRVGRAAADGDAMAAIVAVTREAAELTAPWPVRERAAGGA